MRVTESAVQTEALLEKEKLRYMGEMADDQLAFMVHLNALSAEVDGLSRFSDIRDVDTAAGVVAGIRAQLEVRCMCVGLVAGCVATLCATVASGGHGEVPPVQLA